MAFDALFQPIRGANRVTTPAAASASVTLNASEINATSVRLCNVGAAICHVRIGTGAQTATTADMPIPTGATVVVRKAEGEDTIAHISATGTTLHIQAGEGIR